MKTKLTLCIVAFLLGAVTPLLGTWILMGENPSFKGLNSGVTVETVRAIDVGMTEEDVWKLLGPPIATFPDTCSCEEEPVHSSCPERIVYQYSRSLNRGTPHPMLWVHFLNGKVSSVYAKRYGVFGDDGVYGKSIHACNPTSRTDKGCVWETEDFEHSFPSYPQQ